MAKSIPPRTLREHTDDVEEAVQHLVAALGHSLEMVTPPNFSAMLRHAAFFHDLGKAAIGFQDMLRAPKGDKSSAWGYRHEALSTAILLSSEFPDISLPQLLVTVLTHHRPIDDTLNRDDNLSAIVGRGEIQEDFDITAGVRWRRKIRELEYYWYWLRNYIKSAEESGRISRLPRQLPDQPSDLPNLFLVTQGIEKALENILDITDITLPWVLARGFLMGGDHLASAGMKGPLTELDNSKILLPIGFQEILSTTIGNAILEAPTGSGKTEAALHWALANRNGGERLFYILPYQASINKMTERLQRLFGADNVGLLHHRAALQEFSRHFESNDNPDYEVKYEAARKFAKTRVEGTKQFYRPIKVLTPYQLIKLFFGCRYFEIGLTELLGGIVIFDEIHAYSPHIAALIEVVVRRFKILQVRSLFMTATLPEFLMSRLQDAVGQVTRVTVAPDDPRGRQILETARHRLLMMKKPLDSCVGEIIKAAKRGEKVLVVCNRIKQSQDLYQVILNELEGFDIQLLHGRFTGADRTRKEARLAAEPDVLTPVEQQVPAADVLVTTQVVEVSLNLSFDLCFTEIAPVDALLQRFGRVNRLNQHGMPVPVYVACIFEEERIKTIYSIERLLRTQECAPAGAWEQEGIELFPERENEWIRRTYETGFTAEEQAQYDRALSSFSEMVQNLRPYYSGKDDDFYDLFDNYTVVPVRLKHKYLHAITEKRFYDAIGYTISLPSGTFCSMRQYMTPDEVNHIWFVNRRYDNDLGLLNEEEIDLSYLREEFLERLS